ncbi:MAG: hypothetical protein II838_03410 [Lachnospiraceae bacterium]|nr:hypothetical protein [Lachnospiraceae bacterium]
MKKTLMMLAFISVIWVLVEAMAITGFPAASGSSIFPCCPRSSSSTATILTMDGERVRARHMHFNMIFNERAAIIYNFSSRYFAGATLVMNNSVFSDDEVTVNQNKWRARALIGVRL